MGISRTLWNKHSQVKISEIWHTVHHNISTKNCRGFFDQWAFYEPWESCIDVQLQTRMHGGSSIKWVKILKSLFKKKISNYIDSYILDLKHNLDKFFILDLLLFHKWKKNFTWHHSSLILIGTTVKYVVICLSFTMRQK
jgi:hypothetical protein